MQIYNNSLSTYNALPKKEVLPSQNLEHYSNGSFNQISPDGEGIKIFSQRLLSDDKNIILVTNQVEDDNVIVDTEALQKKWEETAQEIHDEMKRAGLELRLKIISLKEEFIRIKEEAQAGTVAAYDDLISKTTDPEKKQELINTRNSSYRSFTQSIAASRAELQYDYDMLNAYYEQQAQEKQKS